MKILGVDIGSHEVKTVLIDAGLVNFSVAAAGFYPIGNGDRSQVVGEAAAGNFDLVALSINRQSVVTRTVTMPFKDREKLEKAVPFEAESQLPFTCDDGYIDFYVVDDQQPGATEVLVFAISHKDFEEQAPVFEASGRTDAFHQVDSYAAVNALLDLGALPMGTVAVLDLGHSKTAIEILHDRKLCFSRVLDVAGEALTQVLAQARGLSASEAEPLKLAALSGTGSAADRAILQAPLERLFREIKFTFKSYASTAGRSPVGCAVLTGGTSRAPAVVELAAEKLGVPVSVATPAAGSSLPHAVAADLTRYAAAYGMALFGRDVTNLVGSPRGEIQADFLREKRSYWKYHKKKISTAVTTVLVLMLLYVVWQIADLQRLHARAAELDTQIGTALADVNRANEGRGRKKIELKVLEPALKEAQRRLNLLKKPPMSNLGILNEVSSLVPRGSSFTVRDFILQSGLVTITADASSNDEADQITESLKKSATFTSVRKVEAAPSQENPQRVQFKVEFKVSSS